MVYFLDSIDGPENMLGGPGYTIEVDESSFKKKSKYGRGKMHPDRWVLGIIERDESRKKRGRKKYFLVPNRNRGTLLSIILKHVKPGSEIMSDGWTAYEALSEHPYDHYVVNHSRSFVEGGRGNERVCFLHHHIRFMLFCYRTTSKKTDSH